MKQWKQSLRKIGAWLLEHPGVFITLVAGFLYIVVWSHYSVFYGTFGIAPNEVGINYGDIVRDALTALLFTIFFTGIFGLGMALSGFLGVTVFNIVIFFLTPHIYKLIESIVKRKWLLTWAYVEEKKRNAIIIIKEELEDITFIPVMLMLIAALGVPTIGVRYLVHDIAKDVKNGKAAVISGISFLSFIQLRVEPVSVRMSHRLPGEFDNREWRSMMLLGRADGITVLYDHERCETIRAPSSSLIIIRPQLKSKGVK